MQPDYIRSPFLLHLFALLLLLWQRHQGRDQGLGLLVADARRESGNLGGHHLYAELERSFHFSQALVKVSLLLARDSGELLDLGLKRMESNGQILNSANIDTPRKGAHIGSLDTWQRCISRFEVLWVTYMGVLTLLFCHTWFTMCSWQVEGCMLFPKEDKPLFLERTQQDNCHGALKVSVQY
jgi:hypothetical protein